MASDIERLARRLELGTLETRVLGIVRRLSKATAREVLRELRDERDFAYTTISTTLDRLYRKGLLTREETKGRGGTVYTYSTVVDTRLQSEAVRSAVTRLVEAFGPGVVSRIYEALEDVPESDLKRLKERLARSRARGVGSA